MALEQKNIAGLIDYISARQPAFRQAIRGANAAQIDALNAAVKQLAGFDLPEDYRQFLAEMGASETPFSFTSDAVHSIDEVLDVHRLLIEEDEKLPPDSFLIAVNGFNVEEIALECFAGNNGKTRSGRIFVPDGERVSEVLGDGFIEYLYGKAFEYTVGVRTPLTATLIGSRREPNLANIENVCARFGLEKQWFSDSITFCACDAPEKTVVYANQKSGGYIWARVSGEDRKTIVALKENLMTQADLTFEKWWNS